MTERWLPVVGYEGIYKVSDTGIVMAEARPRVDGRFYHPRILGQSCQNGYPCVSLWANGKTKRAYVHRLVAEAFIDNPLDKSQVNHKDGDKGNPVASNLEWVTSSENSLHAIRTGLQARVTAGAFRKGAKPWNAGKKTGRKPWNYINDRSCKTDGCTGSYYCRGMCQKCHRRTRYLSEHSLLPPFPSSLEP